MVGWAIVFLLLGSIVGFEIVVYGLSVILFGVGASIVLLALLWLALYLLQD